MPSSLEIAIPALCAWRENRGGQRSGMQSIVNVLHNRAVRDNSTMYAEAVRRIVNKAGHSTGQFSSMTTSGDPELTLWPVVGDPQMAVALDLTQEQLDGQLPDITLGATLYYAPRGITTVLGKVFTPPNGTAQPFPDDWNLAAVHFTAEIQGQLFFKEG